MVELNKNECLKFISFAIKQAKEAERFGFTRNECSRNLKTALHQYWQNKVLGQNGISRKKYLTRSKRAKDKDLSECEMEHLVPVMHIVNDLMDRDQIALHELDKLLRDLYHVRLVTKEEHHSLTKAGLRSKMPDNWDGKDIWARYKEVGIEFIE